MSAKTQEKSKGSKSADVVLEILSANSSYTGNLVLRERILEQFKNIIRADLLWKSDGSLIIEAPAKIDLEAKQKFVSDLRSLKINDRKGIKSINLR